MYEKQFAITARLLGEGYEPEMFYAVEPSIQMYIAEKSEALRELYVSSYSYAATANYIHQMATDKLVELFGAMHPQYTRQDFYELELATSGMVRSFMARKCDRNFTMEQKLRRFLSCSMTIYGVAEEKQQQVIDRVLEMDLKSVADQLVADAIHQADEQYQEAERKGKAIEGCQKWLNFRISSWTWSGISLWTGTAPSGSRFSSTRRSSRSGPCGWMSSSGKPAASRRLSVPGFTRT